MSQKLWFTCSELAALKLPGIPTAQQSVDAYAKRHGWDRLTDDLGHPMRRKRKGRGGGWEYSVWALAALARHELLVRQADPIGLTVEARRRSAEQTLAALETEIIKAERLLVALRALNDEERRS